MELRLNYYFDCDDQLKTEIGKYASPLGYLP